MLSISPQQMKQMADERRRRMEDAWILKELRDAYGSVLVALDDGFLRSEITACLARCNELGLHSSKDRLSFCFIDIVGFPGFKSLPKLPELIAKCRKTAPDSSEIMLELQRIAPTAFWVGLLDRTQTERERRGMPV